MGIGVTCSCGRRLLAREEFLGQQVKCPYCGQWVNITTSNDSMARWRAAQSERASTTAPESKPRPGPTQDFDSIRTDSTTTATGAEEPPPRGRGPTTSTSASAPLSTSTSRLIQSLSGLAIGMAILGAGASRLSDSLWGAALAALGMLPACLALVLANSSQMVIALGGLLCCGTVTALILTEPRVKLIEAHAPSAAGGVSVDDPWNPLTTKAAAASPVSEADWTLAWDPDQRGSMRASLITAEIADPLDRGLVTSGRELDGDPAQRLILSLRIRNASATEVVAWQSGGVRLVDDRGRTYPNLKRMSGQRQPQYLLPGQAILEQLIFAAPPPGVLNLNLELANAAPSQGHAQAVFRIRIPGALVKR